MEGASPKAVEAPDENHVEFLLCRVGHQTVKGGARCFRAAHALVDIFAHHAPALVFAIAAQVVQLGLGGLAVRLSVAVGRDASVERHAPRFGFCARRQNITSSIWSRETSRIPSSCRLARFSTIT